MNIFLNLSARNRKATKYIMMFFVAIITTLSIGVFQFAGAQQCPGNLAGTGYSGPLKVVGRSASNPLQVYSNLSFQTKVVRLTNGYKFSGTDGLGEVQMVGM